MPMYKRMITPVEVSRNAVDKGVRNELECVSNNTLANLLLQLSSLSKMSEDLFTEVHLETCRVFYRTCQIIKRVEALKYKIIQLNPIAEEVSLRDITQREPFRSEVEKDQEIITVATRPRAINDMYLSIERSPCLHILDPYRDDGKKSIKFYTNPGYFFELWQKQMAANTEVQLKKKNAKVKRKLSKRLLDQGDMRPPVSEAPNHVPSLPPSIPHPSNFVVSEHNGNKASLQQLQEEALLQQQYEYEQQVLQQQQQQAYQLFNSDQQSAWNTGQSYDVDQGYSKDQSYVDGDVSLPLQPPSPIPPPCNFYQPDPASNLPPSDNLSDFLPPSETTDNFSDLPPPPQMFPEPSFNLTPPLPSHPANTSETHNDSYMPSPPQNLLSQPDGTYFKFSAGVEDLLSRIEGTHLIHTPHKATRDNSPARTPSNDHAPTHQASFNDHSAPIHDASTPAQQATSPTTHISRDASARRSFEMNHTSPSHTNGVIANQQPHMVRDDRSDLLSAIRQGIQLRKVAETKQQQKKRRTTGRLDVQTIMEAAFEVRRKAMEGDDDEDEEEEDDSAWSD